MFQFGGAWSFVWGLSPPQKKRGDGTELNWKCNYFALVERNFRSKNNQLGKNCLLISLSVNTATMTFISLSTILERKEYLEKMNNLPNHHGAGRNAAASA